jgi:DNA repair protein RecN (Recombination protein N)
MLVELSISGLGVIESANVVFGAGLTVLSGETGAGKTMIVEALQLLLGGRADPGVVRHGSGEARVEGRFVVGEAQHDGAREMVLCRVVPLDGRSRAYIDGRLATAAQLAELGAELVELHGQHAHQQLVSTAAQRAALDAFAGTDLTPLRAARARLTEIDAAMAALGGDARARAREADLLRFQCGELDAAAIDGPDEDDRLSAQEDLLSDAVGHAEAGGHAAELLSADGGAVDALAAAGAALSGRAPFADLAVRLAAAAEEVVDIAREARAVGEQMEDDPETLEAVRLRRKLLHDLRRKYGDTLAEVIGFHDEIRARLAEIEQYDQTVIELEGQRGAALGDERKAALAAQRTRRSAAPRLAEEIERLLRSLAMADAEVRIDVGEQPPGDDVAFLLAANVGSPPQPLSRVASGGELARAMLALRLVLAGEPETMVFDEVDAGIGGAVAAAVGEALAQLAVSRQVLVVTHLAQVAALATTHLVVTKSSDDVSTVSQLREVTGDDRVAEIARMLSGDADGGSARAHASELLLRGRSGRRG